MNRIYINLGQGGLGRPLPGKDHYSGLLCFTAANLPGKFTANTPATSAQAVTVESTANDVITQIAVNGTYLLNAAITFPGTSLLDDATRIVNGINAFTGTSGYSATVGTGGAFTINGPVAVGATINTMHPVYTFGTDATLAIATNGAFSGGVTTGGNPLQVAYQWSDCQALGMSTSDPDKDLALFAYTAQMFFEANPQGVLYLYPYKVAGAANTFANLVTLQQFAGGQIRQFGVVSATNAFVYTDLNLLKAQRTILQTANRPCEIFYGADTSGLDVAALAGVTDLSTLNDDGVTLVIGQDGSGLGASLAVANGCSFPMVGTLLGAASYAKVNECIAWVNKFDISKNTIGEYNTLALGNGVKIDDITVSAGLLNSLDAKRYVFGVYQDGITGSFFNDSHCACALISDYAYIENNRTINKAQRNVRIALLPDLNAPLFVNADGTLAEDTLADFLNTASQPLETMLSNKEISSYEVIIDPTQNVLATSTLTVTIKIVPVGVARTITVNIQYTVSVA